MAASLPDDGVEHVSHLREQGNLRGCGDVAGGDAFGFAAPVPMFIEVLDGRGDVFGKAHLAGNVGTAVAAGFDQFAGNLAAIAHDVDDGAETFGHAGLQAGVGQHKAQGLAAGCRRSV